MKALKILKAFCTITFLLTANIAISQNPENWTKDHLVEPAQLAQAIQANKNVPVIFSVGPGATIPHSITVGPAREKDNLDKLKKELAVTNKDTAVVIYCGCCPFEHCPNVRPAINLLKEMKFTNYKLLNLSHNIKTDWLDKGYPASKM